MTDGQLFLPFDFLREEEEKKQKELEAMPHFENPSNDNECLLEFQYQYKVNGKQEALSYFYQRAVDVCKKFINHSARKNKHLKLLSESEREEKAEDAANYIVEKYLSEKYWFIKSNVPGYLFLRVLKELFYQSKADKIVDFVDWEEFTKQEIEEEEEAENDSLY